MIMTEDLSCDLADHKRTSGHVKVRNTCHLVRQAERQRYSKLSLKLS